MLHQISTITYLYNNYILNSHTSALGQVQQVTKTQLAGTPLNAVQIIQQQQQPKLPQAVTVQQFQQIVKQQQAAQQGIC